MTPTPMKAVEIRSLAEKEGAAKAEAAVAAVAVRKNARRAMLLVGITEMLSQAAGKGDRPRVLLRDKLMAADTVHRQNRRSLVYVYAMQRVHVEKMRPWSSSVRELRRSVRI
jgi:hypothetical protein